MYKSGTTSILNEVKYNQKIISSTLMTESALYNINKIRTIRDQTTDAFVDTLFSYDYNLSDAQNNVKTVKRNLFLMFVYDYFNLYVLMEFEIYLMNNNVNLLDNIFEDVKFLFKGGNVLFTIIHDLMIKYNIFDNINIDDVNSIKTFFTESFKVSDFDFTTIISCKDNKKFNEIKKYLTKFLINKLEEITLFFNSYFIQSMEITNNFTYNKSGFYPINENLQNPIPNPNAIPLTQLDTMIDNNLGYSTELELINLLFSNLYNNDFFDTFVKVIKQNILPKFSLNIILNGNITNELLDNYGKLLSTFTSYKIEYIIFNMIQNIRNINSVNARFRPTPVGKLYNSKVINVFSKLKFINEKYKLNIFSFNVNLQDFYDKNEKYFNDIKSTFLSIDFYSEEVFINILEKVKSNLNKIRFEKNSVPKVFVEVPKNEFLFKDKKDYFDESNYETVKLVPNNRKSITHKQLKISSKDDMIMTVDQISKEIYSNNKTQNFHYISYNSSINTILDNFSSFVDFDLLRCKFNFVVSNIYKKKFLPNNDQLYVKGKMSIPSEFIDISIISYFNSIKDFKTENFYFYKFNIPIQIGTIINNDFIVESFTIDYSVHDLLNILFIQNSFYPWLDQKYEKRMKRLFFLFGIQVKQGNLRYLFTIYDITNMMIQYIANNNILILQSIYRFTPVNSLQKFREMCQYIRNNDKSLSYFRFANDALYDYGLDELINFIFFAFFARIYNINDDEILEIINHLRNKYMLYSLTNAELIPNFISKIDDFLIKTRDLSQIIFITILTIEVNLNNIP